MSITPTLTYRRILILDDASVVAETLGTILSRQGYDARVAHSAEEAIETIANWQPDLAFVDVMLPGMNGIEFGKVLRSNYPACELVLISGHPGSKELAEIARTQGQSLSILPKPLNPTVILAIAAGQPPMSIEATDA
jgi:two-component system, NtrC family, response regulator AtoC